MLWDKNNIDTVSNQSNIDSIRLNNCYYDDGIERCMDSLMYVHNLSDYMQQIFDYQYIHSLHELRYEEHISSNATYTQNYETVKFICRITSSRLRSFKDRILYNRKR